MKIVKLKIVNSFLMLRIVTYKLTNILPSDSVNSYIEEKLANLDKLLDKFGTPHDCAVEIGHTTRHHKKGKVFRAEADLVLPRRVIRAEAEAYDIYAAIDMLREELDRQVKSYKGKLRTKLLKGARSARGKQA